MLDIKESIRNTDYMVDFESLNGAITFGNVDVFFNEVRKCVPVSIFASLNLLKKECDSSETAKKVMCHCRDVVVDFQKIYDKDFSNILKFEVNLDKVDIERLKSVTPVIEEDTLYFIVYDYDGQEYYSNFVKYSGTDVVEASVYYGGCFFEYSFNADDFESFEIDDTNWNLSKELFSKYYEFTDEVKLEKVLVSLNALKAALCKEELIEETKDPQVVTNFVGMTHFDVIHNLYFLEI